MSHASKFFMVVGGLSSKAFAILVTGTSAFFGLVLGETFTNQASGAAFAGAVATALAAIFLIIPRIMEQLRKSRESTAQLQKDSISLLVSAHDRDLGFYKSEIAALKLERAMLIDSKHKTAGEWFAALNAYGILAGQLRALGQRPEIELHPAKYADIVGEADQALKDIAASNHDSEITGEIKA